MEKLVEDGKVKNIGVSNVRFIYYGNRQSDLFAVQHSPDKKPDEACQNTHCLQPSRIISAKSSTGAYCLVAQEQDFTGSLFSSCKL